MKNSEPLSLLNIYPDLSTDELLAQLIPPREFEAARFENYIPDEKFESQTLARDLASSFAKNSAKFLKQNGANHIYLDGGFGVGKTHLLASVFHESKGKKAFGSFLAFTGLIGAIGFAECMKQLSSYDLICIDEFELDDPGDTMLLSRMLSELDAKGVRFASTSNTPPNVLGKGRFAAEDFAREISAMANRFKMISVEGEDFRHRSSGADCPVLSYEALGLWVDNLKSKNSLVAKNGFDELLNHLSELHPTKYGALIKNLYGLALENVYQIQDQVAALRWVACVDRLYEAQVRIANTGIPLTQVFSEEMTGGTYRKKYLRAISRLGSLVDV